MVYNIEAITEYVFYATTSVLSASIAKTLYPLEGEETPKSSRGSEGWHLTIQPNVLRKNFEGGTAKQMIVDVSDHPKKGIRLRVGWDWMRLDPFGTSTGKALDQERKSKGEGVYEWRVKRKEPSEGGLEEVVRSLDDVVEQAGKMVVISVPGCNVHAAIERIFVLQYIHSSVLAGRT
ncbi:hypothetical protein M7I_3337 [Glarea lozoyensis 74030]|uniref:Uncharacterized protein n=1 Tax=Glarea lozoyensis (strain ATCC 74030 / MF5533) TaxID=1104152 RepID=H0EL77_GLAL7|nr:hypothetical protein M7I_3337 [Glarea lozoyensis 74030]